LTVSGTKTDSLQAFKYRKSGLHRVLSQAIGALFSTNKTKKSADFADYLRFWLFLMHIFVVSSKENTGINGVESRNQNSDNDWAFIILINY